METVKQQEIGYGSGSCLFGVWCLCRSLGHADTHNHATNTCLSFHACQLVHPTQQGEYISYFGPDLQHVEVADINGVSSLCDTHGLGSEWRRAFSFLLEAVLVPAHLERTVSAQ